MLRNVSFKSRCSKSFRNRCEWSIFLLLLNIDPISRGPKRAKKSTDSVTHIVSMPEELIRSNMG